MREISLRDLEVVAGGFGPAGAAIGAVTSAASYIGHATTSGEGSISDFILYTAGGATVGFFTGGVGGGAVRSIAQGVVGSLVGYYSGVATGSAARMVNEAGTNYPDLAGLNYQK